MTTSSARRTASAAGWALILGLVLLFWPQTFGGSTAYIGVDGQSMDGTYVTGDLIVVREQSAYSVGDVITYRVPEGEFGAGAHVIHRIIGGNDQEGFLTQGDNKPLPDEWRPRNGDIVGKSWIRIPGAAIRFQQLGQPVPLGALCAGLTIFVMLLPKKEKERYAPAAHGSRGTTLAQDVLPGSAAAPQPQPATATTAVVAARCAVAGPVSSTRPVTLVPLPRHEERELVGAG